MNTTTGAGGSAGVHPDGDHGDAVEIRDTVGGGAHRVERGSKARSVVFELLARLDHPRFDTRGNPLDYRLVDDAGRSIGDDEPVTTTATLTSPDAADVRSRIDEWLIDIDLHGEGTASISAAARLALIERTGARLDDVARLRARLDRARQERLDALDGGERRSLVLPGGRTALGLALVVAGLALAGGVWWTVGRGGDTDLIADAGAGADGEVVALPAELDLAIASGESQEVSFAAEEGQDITILMLTGQNRFGPGLDPQIELLDPDGNQIAYNDDRMDGGGAGNPLNSRIDITIPSSGVHTVVASDLSGSNPGAFLLIIEEGGPGGDGQPRFFEEDMAVAEEGFAVEEAFPAGDGPMLTDIGCAIAEPIVVESLPFETELEVGCEVQVFRFDRDEPIDLVVEVVRLDPDRGDPVVWLLGQGDVILRYDDDGLSGLDSFLDQFVDEPFSVAVGNLQGDPAQPFLLSVSSPTG